MPRFIIEIDLPEPVGRDWPGVGFFMRKQFWRTFVNGGPDGMPAVDETRSFSNNDNALKGTIRLFDGSGKR